MNEMANVASVGVDFSSTNVKHDVSYDNDISSKNSDFNLEQNDSRISDPDGAQSPASSTYADCEDQNDNSNSENLSETDKKDVIRETDDKEKDSISNEIVESEKSDVKDLDNIKSETDKSEEQNSECIDEDISEQKECGVEGQVEHPEDESSATDVEIIDDNNRYENASENEEDGYVEEHVEDLYDNKEHDDKSELDDEGSDSDSLIQEIDRENGDGEEVQDDDANAAQKKLDDDEDRRNPQYIPKKGVFYEHDDRTVTDDESVEKEKKETEANEKNETPKGKSKRAIPDGRWEHDMYKEDEQKSKSKQELIDSYGYDIRNEESAPKARRRRRYGRGPNKYTRKWDDETAYNKQMLSKPFPQRFQRGDYNQQFPALSNEKPHKSYRSKEISASKKVVPQDAPVNDDPVTYKNDVRANVPPQKPTSKYQEKSRNFDKRLSNVKEQRPAHNSVSDNYDQAELRFMQKTIRNTNYTSNTENATRVDSRGAGHGKTGGRYNDATFDQGPRLPFTPPGSRGRSRRLVQQSQYYYSGKSVPNSQIQEVTEQISTVDLSGTGGKRNAAEKNSHPIGDSEPFKINEQYENQQSASNATSSIRSKRYSHQRQRLLPDASKNNPANVSLHQNVQQNMQPITHSVQNVQNVTTGMCQAMTSTHQTHQSMPLMTQNQCTPPQPPQSVAAPLSVTSASIPSSSMAVSASLIPLSAPPLTASGPGLSAPAPPLPIMGFFQHPQGFTNQGTATQLYTRDQSVLGAPSNQPVQLVAFLPASPMMPNTNHSQSAPPPPPPPPPPGFPTTVMSYQQPSQTPPNPSSFNSDSYSIPPVTLAPIPQPPEVYQSRGGVTYYNTRSQVKPRSPPPPRVKAAIPIVPPPANESIQ